MQQRGQPACVLVGPWFVQTELVRERSNLSRRCFLARKRKCRTSWGYVDEYKRQYGHAQQCRHREQQPAKDKRGHGLPGVPSDCIPLIRLCSIPRKEALADCAQPFADLERCGNLIRGRKTVSTLCIRLAAHADRK